MPKNTGLSNMKKINVTCLTYGFQVPKINLIILIIIINSIYIVFIVLYKENKSRHFWGQVKMKICPKVSKNIK